MRIVYHHRTRSTDAQRIHIQEIVRAFEEIGHEVELVSLVPTGTAQNDAARDAGDAFWKRLVRRIPYSYELVQLGYNLAGIPMLLRALLSRPDFIYERYSLFNFAGVLTARLRGVPIYLEVNSPFALEQSRDSDIRLRRLAEWSERAICNLATRVIVVSTPLRRIMESAGVPARKLTVMPNGVRLEHFQSDSGSPELRRKLGLENCLVAGFVGWFRKWHGLELLLEAFLRSGLSGHGVKVLLIGDGPATADLKSFVRTNHLESSVVFSGPVPHAEVPRYLDLVDIAVQPAANEYCCPMKILEYMALAKPIVAPRQENIQELLEEGREALFFSPGDAASLAAVLRDTVRDKDRARQIGRAARAAINQRGLLWAANAARVIEFFENPGKTAAAARPALALDGKGNRFN
jgi:glycosyltransferase involved in cell wall biosynthesis